MLAFPPESVLRVCMLACRHARYTCCSLPPVMGFTCDAGPSLHPDSCVTRRRWQLLHRLSVVYGRPLSSPSPCLCLFYLWTSFISSVTLHDQTWDHNNKSFWLALLPLAPRPQFFLFILEGELARLWPSFTAYLPTDERCNKKKCK